MDEAELKRYGTIQVCIIRTALASTQMRTRYCFAPGKASEEDDTIYRRGPFCSGLSVSQLRMGCSKSPVDPKEEAGIRQHTVLGRPWGALGALHTGAMMRLAASDGRTDAHPGLSRLPAHNPSLAKRYYTAPSYGYQDLRYAVGSNQKLS